MAKSFSKYNPRKIISTPVEMPSANEANPEHNLSDDLPLSTEEARDLLDRVRDHEEKDFKITSLEEELETLRNLLSRREEALSELIKDLSNLHKTLKTNALDQILLGADDMIRKAISDQIPDLIEKRIEEMQEGITQAAFYASQETCDFLKLPIITTDNQIPINIIKCIGPNGSEFIIEVNPS